MEVVASKEIRNKYSLFYKMKLLIWLFRTKLIAKNARLIRFPFDIRGRKYIDLGYRLTTGIGCRLEAFSINSKLVLFFGSNVQLNDYVHICAVKEVRIGNNVLMAGHVYISDNSHGIYKGYIHDSSPEIPPVNRSFLVENVIIEDNVWLGEGVIVLPGVTIGKGCVIGAHAVVSQSIPPYTVAVGIPAKPIKKYDFVKKKWLKTN